VKELLTLQHKAGNFIAAICAGIIYYGN